MQVVTFDSNVAVVDDQVFETSCLDHLLKIAHLYIGAEYVWADDQLDRAVRELPLQTLHTGDSRIDWITNTENNFVIEVVLQTVTAEALIDFGIDSLERLQDGNRRCI